MSTTYRIPGLTVHEACSDDADTLLGLIDALAAYEKLDPPSTEAKARLVRDIFGDHPRLEAYLAWTENTAIGYALILETYSSFLALPTLYLEDIFVLEEYRGKKAGLALYLTVARIARERGCGRLDFTVLDWNTSAQKFYQSLHAHRLPEWHLYRTTAEELSALPTPEFEE